MKDLRKKNECTNQKVHKKCQEKYIHNIIHPKSFKRDQTFQTTVTTANLGS